nr:MAG TPA: hypothetical protein [Caudoviricetes sp.]
MFKYVQKGYWSNLFWQEKVEFIRVCFRLRECTV